MNLTRLAASASPVVWMLLAILMGFGVWSYFTLPAREDPKITVREAIVSARYPGLSPERMERLVTKTLEEAIRRVEEVEEIRSTSSTGLSLIHVEVDDSYFDLDQIWDDVEDQVARVVPDLPEGTSEPIVDSNFGDVAVITLALTADGFTVAEMADMADHIRDMLYAVEGTAKVDVVAAQEERIYIETSSARLAELGVGPSYITDVLAAQNMIRPGGSVEVSGRSFTIEPTGDFRDLEAIRETLIRLPDGATIPLRDIATVTRTTVDPPQRKAYYNGEEAIILAISMLDGERVLDYASSAREAIEDVVATLPVGFDLDIVTFQAEQVERAVYGMTMNVGQTLVIVLGVVVMLLGLRTGLIVGAIVPSVMLITLAVMGFAGLPLERMSLATLVIALGLLVDAGVVVAEDFKTRLENGESRDDALAAVGRELQVPLLISTATTVLAFLPLMLADHVAGEYTRSISLVILISLSASWVVAMTVTPLLAHNFIKVERHADGSVRRGLFERAFDPIGRWYDCLVRAMLRARWLVLALTGLSLAGGVVGMAAAPSKFFPGSDRPQILVYVDLPAGVSSHATDEAVRALIDIVEEPGRFPEITSHAAYVGFGGPRFVLSLTPIDPAPNRGFMVLNVRAFGDVPPLVDELRLVFADEMAEADTEVTTMFLGPTDSSVIEVQVKGPDADFIFATAERLEKILADVDGTINVTQDWENRIASIVVDVDQTRARRAGVTSTDVARSLSGYFSGVPASEFRSGDDTIPIVARGAADERGDLGREGDLVVYPQGGGEPVLLSQVADVALRNGFAEIERENMIRTVTVSARNTRMSAEEMAPLIEDDLAALSAEMPLNHTIELDGVVAQSAEGRAALMANFPLVIAVMGLLLVVQFRGYVRPAIILGTIPLVIVGVALGLHTMSADFGFMPILGVLSLAGIIINNAIVLIDRIDIERAEDGADDFEALVSACRRRLRPITMTTITTVLGLLPLIVSHDALFYGMASVMAFGLVVATVLTLGIVPVLYSLAFGIRPAPERTHVPRHDAEDPDPADPIPRQRALVPT